MIPPWLVLAVGAFSALVTRGREVAGRRGTGSADRVDLDAKESLHRRFAAGQIGRAEFERGRRAVSP